MKIMAFLTMALLLSPQASQKPTIKLTPIASGLDTAYALEVHDADADQAVVRVFYRTQYSDGLPPLMLSEIDVVPVFPDVAMQVGPFRFRGKFIEVAWVEVQLVKTVEKKRFEPEELRSNRR